MLDKNKRDAVFSLTKDCQFSSIRFENRCDDVFKVADGHCQPRSLRETEGVFITVVKNSGSGYAATSNLSFTGLQNAAIEAKKWAEVSAKHSIIDHSEIDYANMSGSRKVVEKTPWKSESTSQKFDRLKEVASILRKSPHHVSEEASFWHHSKKTNFWSSAGQSVDQEFSYLLPSLSVTGQKKEHIQSRSFGSSAYCLQGGLELLEQFNLPKASLQVAIEMEELLDAPNCPSGDIDIICSADQMILQIHESIGHPIEMDRILGDERNYAGTSFVTPDMFGTYQYGSEMLNITYDPSIDHQVASFDFDDEGLKAEKVDIIKNGLLLRPLGGHVSSNRSKLESVANSRSCNWNRPPIDRMANLNLEVGNSSLNQLIEHVEHGIYMQTNCSWSIDDSRNKFQFGCEYGRMIRNGKLEEVVRNPNYRGISAEFWRRLAGVGDASTYEVMGTPYCGKGEPNQSIHVGHASPACLFKDISVFGGNE